MSKVPSEKQLESTFEVLAWLHGQIETDSKLTHLDKDRAQFEVAQTQALLRLEVTRCLEE